jgi:acetyl esterase/lipase
MEHPRRFIYFLLIFGLCLFGQLGCDGSSTSDGDSSLSQDSSLDSSSGSAHTGDTSRTGTTSDTSASSEITGTSSSEISAESGETAESQELSAGEVTQYRNIAYGPDAYWNTLDIYAPENLKAPAPVLFFVHGGAWNIPIDEIGGETSAGDDKDDYVAMGNMFAGYYQYVTVVIRYRLSINGMDPDDGGAVYPEHMLDVAQAFAWVLDTIDQYQGDPAAVFVMGHSAGAHLSSVLGTDERYLLPYGHSTKDIRGLIPISGIFDLTVAPELLLPTIYDVFGTVDEAVMKDASPFFFLDKQQAPTLVVYCWDDMPEFDQQSLNFYASLAPRGAGTWLEELTQEEIPAELIAAGEDCHVAEIKSFSDRHPTSYPVRLVTNFIDQVLKNNIPPWLGPNADQYWAPYLSASSNIGNHSGPANSDFTQIDPPSDLQSVWYALGGKIHEDGSLSGIGGKALFTSQTNDDTRGMAYITTGTANGPNLHAFYTRTEQGHEAGQLAWDSGSIAGPGGDYLDSCAFTSSPIIDTAGTIYIGDCHYLWAMTPQGTLLWATPLPQDDDGQIRPIITGFFTQTGQVGGITSSGNLVLYSMKTGQVLSNTPYRLPGVLPLVPESQEFSIPKDGISECIWKDLASNDMLDPKLRDQILLGFLGVAVPVANQPAVMRDANPNKTRVYVPALLASQTGDLQDLKLYRIDITYHPAGPGTKEFITIEENTLWRDQNGGLVPGGNGCASSPDLAHDGSAIYLADSVGIIHAFEANSGAELWHKEIGQIFGSMGTTWPSANHPKHVLLAMTINGLTCLDPQNNGEILWHYDYTKELAGNLPTVQGYNTIALPNGFPVETPNRIIMPFVIGYQIGGGDLSVWPMQSRLVVFDRSGGLRESYPLKDSSEIGAIPDNDGNVYVMYASMLTSTMHCFWEKNLFPRLPEPMKPMGGLEVFRRILPE